MKLLIRQFSSQEKQQQNNHNKNNNNKNNNNNKFITGLFFYFYFYLVNISVCTVQRFQQIPRVEAINVIICGSVASGRRQRYCS